MEFKPPLVIAHRGASACFDEHSPAAYAAAWAMGADLIEPDLVLTRDDQLLCLHDLWLDRVTDAASRWADRRRPDGKVYALDLTWEEIRQANAPGERGRPAGLCRLEDLCRMLCRVNSEGGRRCGLLLELKDPAFHRREGRCLEARVLELLDRCWNPEFPCLLQSFDAGALHHLAQQGAPYPLLVIHGAEPPRQLLLEQMAWAAGFSLRTLLLEGLDGKPAALARWLAAELPADRELFAWTFGADSRQIVRFVREYGITGVISNNPDVAVSAFTEAGYRPAAGTRLGQDTGGDASLSE